MRILKIKGKNKQIILDQIKKEYGDTAVIISTQEEKDQGIWGFLKQKIYVVTVAVGDEEMSSQTACENTHEKMFMELKEQLSSIRREIDTVKEQKPTDNKLIDETFEVEERLKEEGLRSEVIQKLLKDIKINTHEGMQVLKNRLLDYLTVGSNQFPQIVIFAGSTGVGKTTTIAKLTAKKVLEEQKKIALFTADTYRIAAVEQLKTYADILGVPLEVIYTREDLRQGIEKWRSMDHIFVDTAGRSHKNISQLQDLKGLLENIGQKEVFLVLNINTTYIDAKNIIDIYREIVGDFKLIFTKLDETDEYGNLINIVDYAKVPVAYITNGQNVPEDIEVFKGTEYVEQLLGRISYE